MAKYAVVDVEQRDAELTEVADAIREHTGDSKKMTIPEMAEALRKLPGPIVATAVGNPIALSDATDLKLRGLKLFGRTTQDGTPSPDNPVPLVSAGDGGSIGVKVAGKNLLPNNATTQAIYDVQFTVDSDGIITANGTATGYADLYIYGSLTDKGEYLYIPKGCKFACGDSENNNLWICREKTKGDIVGVNTINSALAEQDCYFYGVALRVPNGNTVNNLVTYAGFYALGVDTSYEPYKEPQTLSTFTPNGLPGIPVTSGGNYTDETGQQWLCDEKDLGRGVHVQRLDAVDMGTLDWVFDGGVNGNNRFICNNFFVGNTTRTVPLMTSFGYECKYSGESFQWWSNAIYIVGKNLYVHDTIETLAEFEERIKGCMLLFPVATPIENALSAEELAAYAAMHTNYPNTTILNDGGAGMEVSYVADTKLYIDNKINAMAAAIVNA